jgi:hypothetical protein
MAKFARAKSFQVISSHFKASQVICVVAHARVSARFDEGRMTETTVTRGGNSRPFGGNWRFAPDRRDRHRDFMTVIGI